MLQFETFYSKSDHVATMLQPDVHLTNSYTHVKFERVLSDIYRGIHQFINVVYYS